MAEVKFNESLVLDLENPESTAQVEGVLANHLYELGIVKESYMGALAEREKNYPTGLACPTAQIAIPHTDPVNLERPYIAIVKPKSPIKFQPMGGMGDEVEAKLVINLGIMRDGGQVEMLQKLMGIFMDEAKSANVLSQTTPEGMVSAFGGYLA